MEIRYGEGFKKQLKRLTRRYRQIKQDINPILEAIQADETPGDQISGTEYTLYKVRAKNSNANRGKSGGYRVIYYLKSSTQCILVTIYSKSDQDDIEQSELIRMVTEIVRSDDPI